MKVEETRPEILQRAMAFHTRHLTIQKSNILNMMTKNNMKTNMTTSGNTKLKAKQVRNDHQNDQHMLREAQAKNLLTMKLEMEIESQTNSILRSERCSRSESSLRMNI